VRMWAGFNFSTVTDKGPNWRMILSDVGNWVTASQFEVNQRSRPQHTGA
jgi:hypothetical protein